MGEGLLGKAAAGLGYLIGLQLLARVFTFILNILIVRSVDASHFGVATVHVQLILSVVLLLSREGFRRAAARCRLVACTQQAQKEKTESKKEKVVNGDGAGGKEEEEVTGMAVDAAAMLRVLWLMVPVGIVVAAAVSGLFLWSRSEEELQLEGYAVFVYVTAAAAVVTLVAEPFWITAQMLLLFRVRVAIEGVAVFLRCVAVFLLARFTSRQLGLLSFALCELLTAVTLLVGYVLYFHRAIRQQSDKGRAGSSAMPFTSLRQMLPSPPAAGEPWIEPALGQLVLTFVSQSVEKLLLTEGAKFVLKFTETLVHQASFSVVSSLGSLVARFLFQPVEEVSFGFFSRLLGDLRSGEEGSEKSKGADEKLRLSVTVLAVLVKFMVLIGLVFCCFGPAYSYLLLDILYGGRYGHETGAPSLLGVYCVYVLCMAVNGVTEAMMNAAASPKELKRYNYALVAFSAVYIGFSVFAIQRWQTSGLVLANCANMLVRIAYSTFFIQRFFRAHGCRGLKLFAWGEGGAAVLPHPLLLLTFFMSFFVTMTSGASLCLPDSPLIHKAAHVLNGAMCFAILAVFVLWEESDFINDLRSLFSSRRDPSSMDLHSAEAAGKSHTD